MNPVIPLFLYCFTMRGSLPRAIFIIVSLHRKDALNPEASWKTIETFRQEDESIQAQL